MSLYHLLSSLLLAAQTTPVTWIDVLRDFIGTIAPAIVIIVALIYLIGTIYTARKNRKTGKEGTEVSEKSISIQATAQLTEMFTEGFKEIRTELAEAKVKIEKLESLVEQLVAERVDMIRHIEALEEIVPNPPGAPARPVYTKHII